MKRIKEFLNDMGLLGKKYPKRQSTSGCALAEWDDVHFLMLGVIYMTTRPARRR